MKFSCPQCGADITLQPRSLHLQCPFCSTPLKLSKEPALEHYRMEPSIEEKPAIAIARDAMHKQDRSGTIETAVMYYLPFYRFLCEKDGTFTEHVYSALSEIPFPLFSIPSGTLTVVNEKDVLKGVKPEKPLSQMLSSANLKKARTIEEMLLLFLPFWKVTLSSGEVIWVDAVEGNTILPPLKKQRAHMPLLRRRVALSILLAVLFLEGILLKPLIPRLLLQGATAGILFYFLIRERKRGS